MYRKFLFLISFVLVLSLAYDSYGDGNPPRPSARWDFVPTAIGSSEITMAATPVDDNDLPVQYYFECTDHNLSNGPTDYNSGWQLSPQYTVAVSPATSYKFRLKTEDSIPNVSVWSSIQSVTTDAVTTPPVLRLDFNWDQNNNDANTQVGFNGFIIPDSGSEINGVVIDLSGAINSHRQDDPCGQWFGSGTKPDPCYFNARAGERLYRDSIYGFGNPPDTVTITLWGLGTNRDYNVMLWSWDSKSTGATNRVAKWTANGTWIFDTNWMGGSNQMPTYINQLNGAGALDLYKWAVRGRATTDNLGRLTLTSTQGPYSPASEPFSIVNGILVEPNALSTFTPTNYAHRPIPRDINAPGGASAACTPVNTKLAWRNGDGVVTHDLYFGDDFNDVNTADTTTQGPGVLIYEPSLAAEANGNPGYDPFDSTGFLELDKTYYWRVDETNAAPTLYKGETWKFTTCPNSVIDDFDEYSASQVRHGPEESMEGLLDPQPAPKTRARLIL